MSRRVLLDESVPRPLAAALNAVGISATAYPNDWKQMRNGELLTLAEQSGFDVLVTSDRSISAQQNLRDRTISIVVLPTNRFAMSWPALRTWRTQSFGPSRHDTWSLNQMARGRLSTMPPMRPRPTRCRQ